MPVEVGIAVPPNDLEALFDRYRREGDLRALGEVFDCTAEELLRIARHLAKDEVDAEDLVQATYLAAIEHADRFDTSRGLVAWLGGILTNKAKLARALSARSPDPDRLPERASEDPGLDAEMREFVQALEAALERVPQAYRRLLRSHLAEGKGPDAIARELERPAGTVRVQLHRGLKHLRRWLPASFALGGLAVATGPSGLAAVRSHVLARAVTLSKAGAAGGAVGSTVPLLGGALVGKKIAAAAGIVLIASGGWWLAKRTPTRSLEDARVRTTQPLHLEAAENAASPLAPSSEPAQRGTAISANTGEGDPYGSLDVEWSWQDGTPAAGVGVGAVSMGELRPWKHQAFDYTDEQGRITFNHLHEGKVLLQTDRGCNSPKFEGAVTRGRRTSATFQLPAAPDVVGHLLDPDGNTVADGTIWVTTAPVAGGSIVARSGADGSYRVRSIGTSCSVFATSARFGSSVIESLRERDSTSTGAITLDLKLLGAPAAVDGLVHDSDGSPVVGAWVTVRCERNTDIWPAVWAATPADGRFRFDGLHAGKIEVEVTSGEFSVWTGNLTIEENGSKHVDVRLEKGFAIEGTIHDADGKPVAGANLLHRALPAQPGEGWRDQQGTQSDDHGNYRLTAVPPGPTQIQVEGKLPRAMGRATTEITGVPGEVLTWSPVLAETGTIFGRVVDESGKGLEGWRVQTWTGFRPEYHPKDGRTDSEGRFELQNCPPVPFLIRAYPPDEKGSSRSRMGVTMENVLAGSGEVTIVVTSSNRPSAFLHGTVADSEGRPVANAWVRAENWELRQGVSARVEEADGSFRVGPLAPGTYSIDVALRGNSTVNLDPVEVAPSEDRDLGTITISAPGHLELVIRREDGAKVDSPFIALVHGRIHHFLTSRDGITFRGGDLYPGRYVLFPIGQNIATEARQIEIQSGETVRLELTVQAGCVQDFDFRPPDGEKGPSEMRVVIRRANGDVVLDLTSGSNMTPDGTRTPSFTASFAPGHYSFEATAKGWRSAGDFEIADTNRNSPAIHALILRAP